MTVIKASDLDKQMGRHIDPNSVPRHDGVEQGSMEGVFAPQSSLVTSHSQVGSREGAAVLSEKEVGGQDFYGSKTVISVNDAPPLLGQFEPKGPISVPVGPRKSAPAALQHVASPVSAPPPVQPLVPSVPKPSTMALPIAAPPSAPPTAPPPVQHQTLAAARQQPPKSTQDLLRSLGLKKG